MVLYGEGDDGSLGESQEQKDTTREISGPHSIHTLKRMYKYEEIDDSTLIWEKNQDDWRPIGEMFILQTEIHKLPLLQSVMDSEEIAKKKKLTDPIIEAPDFTQTVNGEDVELKNFDSFDVALYCQVCSAVAVSHSRTFGEQNVPYLISSNENLVYHKTSEKVSQIIPGFLWIGNSKSSDYQDFNRLAITLLVNGASELKNPPPHPPYFRCRDSKLEKDPHLTGKPRDALFAEIFDVFEHAYMYIEFARTRADRLAEGDPITTKISKYGPTDKFGRPVGKDLKKMPPDHREQSTKVKTNGMNVVNADESYYEGGCQFEAIPEEQVDEKISFRGSLFGKQRGSRMMGSNSNLARKSGVMSTKQRRSMMSERLSIKFKAQDEAEAALSARSNLSSRASMQSRNGMQSISEIPAEGTPGDRAIERPVASPSLDLSIGSLGSARGIMPSSMVSETMVSPRGPMLSSLSPAASPRSATPQMKSPFSPRPGTTPRSSLPPQLRKTYEQREEDKKNLKVSRLINMVTTAKEISDVEGGKDSKDEDKAPELSLDTDSLENEAHSTRTTPRSAARESSIFRGDTRYSLVETKRESDQEDEDDEEEALKGPDTTLAPQASSKNVIENMRRSLALMQNIDKKLGGINESEDGADESSVKPRGPFKMKHSHNTNSSWTVPASHAPPRVLVYSNTGNDRACAIVAAYLVRQWGLSLKTALKVIESSRPSMKIGALYMEALERWAEKYSIGKRLCMACISMGGRREDVQDYTHKGKERPSIQMETARPDEIQWEEKVSNAESFSDDTQQLYLHIFHKIFAKPMFKALPLGEHPSLSQVKPYMVLPLCSHYDSLHSDESADNMAFADPETREVVVNSRRSTVSKLSLNSTARFNMLNSYYRELHDLRVSSIPLSLNQIKTLFAGLMDIKVHLRKEDDMSENSSVASREYQRFSVTINEMRRRKFQERHLVEINLLCHLRTIALIDCGIDCEGVGVIVKSLFDTVDDVRSSSPVMGDGAKKHSVCLNLTRMDLSSNRIGPEGALMLASFVEDNDTLESLNMSNNPLGDDGGATVIHSFGKPDADQFDEDNKVECKFNVTAKHLSISNVELGGNAVHALENMLVENNALQSLDIDFNSYMPAHAFVNTFEALSMYNTSLTRLSLSQVPLSIGSAAKLGIALGCESVRVRELVLSHCGLLAPHLVALCIGDDSDEVLVEYVAEDDHLLSGQKSVPRQISINEREVAKEVRRSIYEDTGNPSLLSSEKAQRDNSIGMSQSTHLKRIDLSGNSIGEKGVEILAAAICTRHEARRNDSGSLQRSFITAGSPSQRDDSHLDDPLAFSPNRKNAPGFSEGAAFSSPQIVKPELTTNSVCSFLSTGLPEVSKVHFKRPVFTPEVVDASCCGLDPPMSKLLLKALCMCESVKSIDLSENNIGSDLDEGIDESDESGIMREDSVRSGRFTARSRFETHRSLNPDSPMSHNYAASMRADEPFESIQAKKAKSVKYALAYSSVETLKLNRCNLQTKGASLLFDILSDPAHAHLEKVKHEMDKMANGDPFLAFDAVRLQHLSTLTSVVVNKAKYEATQVASNGPSVDIIAKLKDKSASKLGIGSRSTSTKYLGSGRISREATQDSVGGGMATARDKALESPRKSPRRSPRKGEGSGGSGSSLKPLGRSLKVLFLAHNQIRNAAAPHIRDCLLTNTSLQHVDLGFNAFTERCEPIMRMACKVTSSAPVAMKLLPLHVNLMGNACDTYVLETPDLARSKKSLRYLGGLSSVEGNSDTTVASAHRDHEVPGLLAQSSNSSGSSVRRQRISVYEMQEMEKKRNPHGERKIQDTPAEYVDALSQGQVDVRLESYAKYCKTNKPQNIGKIY